MTNFGFLLGKTTRDTWRRFLWPYLPFPMKLPHDEEHLAATMQWLKRACEQGRGGASSHYNPVTGSWRTPFPETTGYIIPTLFDYARCSHDSAYGEMAVSLANWLGEVQLTNGACQQGNYSPARGIPKPIIFNTGQNIFGFLRTYRETRERRYLDHAIRAGDFLTASVDDNGIWNRALHHGIPHTYNTRTAWALLELYEHVPKAPYAGVARVNLDWAAGQQTENGWFRHANFKPGELPNTHGLAYTARGLVEAFCLTYDDTYLRSAKKIADKIVRLFEIRKHLFTFWDAQWRNHGKYFHALRGRYVCVTGNLQWALIWMRLYDITGDPTYVSSAFKMIDFVKTIHDVDSKQDGIRGGIQGAFPIYGSYSVLKYPNWAAKFFADALMMKIRLKQDSRLTRHLFNTNGKTHENSGIAPVSEGRTQHVEA